MEISKKSGSIIKKVYNAALNINPIFQSAIMEEIIERITNILLPYNIEKINLENDEKMRKSDGFKAFEKKSNRENSKQDT